MQNVRETANFVKQVLVELGSKTDGAGDPVISVPPTLITEADIVDYIKGATSPYKYMELALYNLARIDKKVSPGVAAGAAVATNPTQYNAAVTALTDTTNGIKGPMTIPDIKAQLKILLPALTDNDAQETVIRYLKSLASEAEIATLFNNKLTGPDAPVVSGGRRRRKSRKSRKARKSRRSRRARRSRRSRRARMMV